MKLNRALTPVFVLLLALPCAAQDLPDPGRRLSKSEQEMDPDRLLEEQRKAAARESSVLRERYRDPQLCERARLNKQMSCGAPNSYKSRSLQCTEAHAYLEQNCY